MKLKKFKGYPFLYTFYPQFNSTLIVVKFKIHITLRQNAFKAAQNCVLDSILSKTNAQINC